MFEMFKYICFHNVVQKIMSQYIQNISLKYYFEHEQNTCLKYLNKHIFTMLFKNNVTIYSNHVIINIVLNIFSTHYHNIVLRIC